MENNKDLLLEYEIEFKELPPLVKELPYESDGYQLMIEYALYNNKKLTYDLINKLIEKFKIRFGVVDEDTQKEDDFAEKLYKNNNNKKSL